MRKILKTIFICLAGFVFTILSIPVCSVSAEIDNTSAFDAVRVTQNYGNDKELIPDWGASGYSSGIICFDMAVQESDWSQATAVRIRITSVDNGSYGPSNSGNNDISFGYAGLSTAGTGKVLITRNKAYSDIKFTFPNGAPHSLLYYPYGEAEPAINIARTFTGCIEFQLNDNTFGPQNGDAGTHIFDREGEPVGSTVDMSQIKFVYVRYDCFNLKGRIHNFGNVEIKVNGVWKTVVDMSKAAIAQKQDDTSWYDTITGLEANQVILDPYYHDSKNVSTAAMSLSKIAASACTEHVDNNGDKHCDRCFKTEAHQGWDIDVDGICDDCNEAICTTCEDKNLNGLCDECGHVLNLADDNEKDENDSSFPINLVLYIVAGVFLVSGGIITAMVCRKGKRDDKCQ